MTGIRGDADCPWFPADSTHFQAFLPTQTMDTLRIHRPAIPSQHGRQSAISKPGSLSHDLTQPATERRLIRLRPRFIPLRTPRLIHDRARPSLGDLEPSLKFGHRRTLPRRAYQFPEATCFSIWLSSDRSATSCFSRRFSSSRSFSRFASSDFIPPYWFRQRWYVASLTSSACNTAARSFGFRLVCPEVSPQTSSLGLARTLAAGYREAAVIVPRRWWRSVD